jgi:hypothetical protein
MVRGKTGNSHGMVRWHSPITMNLKITKLPLIGAKMENYMASNLIDSI